MSTATASVSFGRIDLSELRRRATRGEAFAGPTFDDVLADRVPAGESWVDEPFFWSQIQVEGERGTDGAISERRHSPARRRGPLVTAGVLSVAVLVAIVALLALGVERATSWLPALIGA